MNHVAHHPMRRRTDLRVVEQPISKPEQREVSRIERWLIPVLVGAVAIFVTSVVWTTFLQPTPFQPLDYSTQRIVVIDGEGYDVEVPQVVGSGLIPSVRVGDDVPVIGDVCNSDDGPVSISGVVSWNRLSPRGFNVEAGRGTNEVIPGCSALGPFENPMPKAVVDDVVRANEPELWQISGTVNINESNGGSTSWVTESFWIIP